jgi:hypothetical protein
MNLTYSSATQPDNAIAWSGGQNDEGAGIYVVPPGYPASIANVDLWIADAGQDPGVHDAYGVSIYDDNGMPGTLLDSVAVGANTSSEQGWYRVRMNAANTTINSGGWYIAWFQSGANVALGTETQSPISRRTYEILGGAWSPYREITVNDFMLSANITVTCPVIIGVNEDVNAALELQAVPNPTSGVTALRYNLPAISDVKFTVVNMFGQQVYAKSTLGEQAGSHALTLDAQDWASGLYYVNLQTTSGSMTTKVVVNH